MKIGNSIQVFTRSTKRRLPTSLDEQNIEQSEIEEDLELPIDLARRGQNLIIATPIVGASTEDISITVNQDILFIHKSATPISGRMDTHYIKECHWGPIAREVHLPLPVDADNIQATLKDGILTITLPIIKSTSRTKVIKIR
ncbi:Hsp20/alpha crystallin family protein [Patescibacteria group bacterium]|nr:Hsp20/alpha crystallin family protein [Patescibacteria group bacterium]